MDPAVAPRRVERLRAVLARHRCDAEIHLTERAGHAAEISAAARSSGATLLLVWGGDGTVNEAGGPLVGSDTALGLIPAGSGNGLAAALGVPRTPEEAIAAALTRPRRAIDVGMVGARAFFNVAGVGFDARVAAVFNARARGSRGKWPYVAIGVREGCRYRAQDYVVQLDGETHRLRALLMVFANGREFGMGARIAPDAQLDDGLLDTLLIADRALPWRFWDARHLAFGSVRRAPGIISRKIRRARIEALAPLEFHADGEPGVSPGPLTIELLPRALWVCA